MPWRVTKRFGSLAKWPLMAMGVQSGYQAAKLPGQIQAAGQSAAGMALAQARPKDPYSWDGLKQGLGFWGATDAQFADYLRRSGQPQVAESYLASRRSMPSPINLAYNSLLSRPVQ